MSPRKRSRRGGRGQPPRGGRRSTEAVTRGQEEKPAAATEDLELDASERWRLALLTVMNLTSRLYVRRRRLGIVALWDSLSASHVLMLSFAALIALGTVGLQTLPGIYTGPGLGWVDALFTATSAVCVTGLMVVDTATYFTVWGQAWILLLVQLGGLGLLTLTSVIVLGIGRRLTLRHQALVSGTGDQRTVDVRRVLRAVLRLTFFTELAGALLLWIGWFDDFGAVGAVWPAIFHSISAFCNAGFSIFTLSLMDHRQDGMVLGTVMLLVIMGGLGFLTLDELGGRIRGRRSLQRVRLSLHSRLVLTTTAVLLVGGAIAFGALEWHRTLAELPIGDRFMNALFGSVTPRTAGFNTVDYARVTEATAFLTIMLMLIGGAPGGTAGGLKVTTIAILAGLAIERMRGEEHLNAWGRTVPDDTVQRAMGFGVIGFTLVTATIFLLLVLEHATATTLEVSRPFLQYMFESVSAFGTVGLSMGATPELSTPGRLLLVMVMFMGRVGLPTVAAAVSLRPRSGLRTFRFGHEDVGIG